MPTFDVYAAVHTRAHTHGVGNARTPVSQEQPFVLLPPGTLRSTYVPILDRYRVDDDRMFAHIVCHLVNEQPLPRELRTALAGLAGLSHAHTGLSDHDPAADHADTGRPTHTWTGTGAELWDCAVSVAGLDGATTWVPDQTLAAAIGA